MHIEERKVTVREVAEGYFNDAEEGVVGYDDQLDIRPKYQREFVYKDRQRDEVIRTVMKGLPLNVMYWVDRGQQYEDDPNEPRYEVLDGQQRTLSLCEYVDGNFSVDEKGFSNLPSDIQKKILDYELFVYVCEGTDSEKLEWFRIINIAGEQLTDQELRNAVYAGPWVSDAKRYFSKTSKTGCAAKSIGADDYLKGTAIRQEFSGDGHLLGRFRRGQVHRGLYGGASARPERSDALELLLLGYQLGEGHIPEVSQGDEGSPVGLVL